MCIVGLRVLGERIDSIATEGRLRYAIDLERMLGSQDRYRLMVGIELLLRTHRAAKAGDFGEIGIAATGVF